MKIAKFTVGQLVLIHTSVILLSGCLDAVTDEESQIADGLDIVQVDSGLQADSGLQVVGTQPTDSSVVDVGTNIRVTFSAEIATDSVTNSTVTVSDAKGPIQGNVDVKDATVNFEPSQHLPTGTSISVSVSSDVADTSGQPLGSDYSWDFRTSIGSAIPEITAFESAMSEHGHRWGEYMDPNGPRTQAEKFYNEYYSSANSFQQISDYLGVPEPWLTYASWSNQVYKNYLEDNNYGAQGYRRYSHGMYGDWMRGGSTTVAEIELLRDNPAYSRVSAVKEQGGSEHLSREIALAVFTNVHSEMAGLPRKTEDGQPRLATFLTWMGSHLYEWRTADYRGTPNVGKSRFAPFVFGITANALIKFIEWERENGRNENAFWTTSYPIDYGRGITNGAATVSWPTIVSAIEDVATWAVEEAHQDSSVSQRMWVPDGSGYASFRYETSANGGGSPDLNLMIAPLYAWLWKETGELKYRDWGDQLFGAGALNAGGAAGYSGKHFNQIFIFSFDYIRWRREGDDKWSN